MAEAKRKEAVKTGGLNLQPRPPNFQSHSEPESAYKSRPCLDRLSRLFFQALLAREDRNNYIVVLLVKFEHQLNSWELVGDAKVDRRGGTDKIHRIGTLAYPGIYILEIKTSLFLLDEYSHNVRLSACCCPEAAAYSQGGGTIGCVKQTLAQSGE